MFEGANDHRLRSWADRYEWSLMTHFATLSSSPHLWIPNPEYSALGIIAIQNSMLSTYDRYICPIEKTDTSCMEVYATTLGCLKMGLNIAALLLLDMIQPRP